MPLWYGHPARTASQGSAAAQCLPSRSGSPRRRGGSSPTAHSVHSRPSRRRIRLSSRLPRRGRRQHGFSASTTVRWAWAISWRTLATCAVQNTRGVATLCVALRDQQSTIFVGFRVWLARQSKVHLRKHPQVYIRYSPYSVLLPHDQCSVTLREGTREAKHDAPQEMCERECTDHCAVCSVQTVQAAARVPVHFPVYLPLSNMWAARSAKRAEGGARDRRVNRRGGRQAAPLISHYTALSST